jgi:glycogen synthase
MRVAFLSFEYPPDTGHGGIATYIEQAGRMLAEQGHEVEVFAGSRTREESTEERGVLVHRLRAEDHTAFSDAVAARLEARHRERRFDVLEAGEFQAEYVPAARRLPDLPLVVKLHSPSFVIRRLMSEGWRYEQAPLKRWLWQMRTRLGSGHTAAPHKDPERQAIALADLVSSPSLAIKHLVEREWGIDPERISVLPYPFRPNPALAAVRPVARGNRVLFLGRIEVRKGVIDLADAIPEVLRYVPDAEFFFVGADGDAPDGGRMSAYLSKRIGRAAGAMRFPPPVTRETLHEAFEGARLAVFPSLWESFGLVCLEAMAAGKPVVVTGGTGLAELMGQGEAGDVVPPRAPRMLARAIVSLLRRPELCARMGQRGRERVAALYSWEVVGPGQVRQYQEAIERHARRPAARALA